MMGKRLPEGWEWKRLGDVVKILDSQRIPIKKDERKKRISNKSSSELIPYYGATGQVGWIDDYIFDEELVLLGEDGVPFFEPTKNKAYMITGKGWVNNHVHVLRAEKSVILNSFLCRYLNIFNYNGYVAGTTRLKLNKSRMSKIPIPLPPLETQRKIVAILEKADETKRLRMQADELTNQLIQSVFLEMFGDPVINNKNWEIKTIEELSSEIVDCPHSTPKYVDYVTDFPCIRTTELKEGHIDWKQMKYLDEHGYKKRVSRLIPIEGDVIYGREGSFGEAVRVPANTNISLGQRVMLFRPKSKICNSIFLWALIRSNSIYFQALKKTSGSTVRHVNIKDIKKFKGICPSIELQHKFTQIVEKVEAMRQSQKQSRQEIDNLFNALMQQAFKGELTP